MFFKTLQSHKTIEELSNILKFQMTDIKDSQIPENIR